MIKGDSSCCTQGQGCVEAAEDCEIAPSEIAWWAAEGHTLHVAIMRASESTMPDGKRHGHQWKIRKGLLPEAGRRLVEQSDLIKQCASFHELWLLVGRTLRNIKGVGELVVYDVSDRIGYHLGLGPDRVYLHAGTRVGALKRMPHLSRRTPWIEMSDLPSEFRSLPARKVEDLFCVRRHLF